MKKKKKRLKPVAKIILLITIISCSYGAYSIYNGSNSKGDNVMINKTLYSEEILTIAKNYNIEEKINEYSYSETLENILLNNVFIEKYLEEYVNITFIDNDTFLNDVNTLLDKNYNADEINKIQSFGEKNYSYALDNDYVNFIKYSTLNYFDMSKIDRYISYETDNNTSLEDTVTHVNIGLDNTQYTNINTISNPSDLNINLNKYNCVPDDYVPDNLVNVGNYSVTLTEEAAVKYMEMENAAKDDGYTFEPTTAYRSYAFQNLLYTNYVASDGIEEAETYSARPGHSEHQLGLAIDIKNPSYYNETGVRLNDEDYAWVLENAHKYGYIVRYPTGKSDITRYIEEPWHLRYLGIELATSVVESGLCYDEYYVRYIETY